MDVGSYYDSERSAKDSSLSLPPQSTIGAREPIDQYMMNGIDNKDDGAKVTHHIFPTHSREARRLFV